MTVRSVVSRHLPASIKNSIKRFAGARRLDPDLAPFLPQLICVDVGASYYPHPAWRLFQAAGNTRWIAVDPNAANLDYAKHWAWPSRIIPCPSGLSRDGGTKRLYRTHVDSGSSLLQPVVPPASGYRVPDTGYFFPLQILDIETITLPDVLAAQPEDLPVFVKLDTQGTELSILQGADALFAHRRILGIEMESTLLAEPIMQGSGKFGDALQFLEARGFELLYLHPIPGRSRLKKARPRGRTVLNECDTVFALRPDIVEALPTPMRVAMLGYYVCNSFFEEALHLMADHQDVREYLRQAGSDIARLTASLNALA
jgi:FkbM family methyltransferase